MEVPPGERSYCITVTLGDVAEPHVGMTPTGTLAECGFTKHDLKKAKWGFRKRGFKCFLYRLNQGLEGVEDSEVEDAFLLIVKGGAAAFTDSDKLLQELVTLEWDKKAKMRNKVVNKRARYNLVFGDSAQTSDVENGKGTVVEFARLPHLAAVRAGLGKVLGEKAKKLQAEGNYYYDVSKCGIGFHGDRERRIVVGVRLGASMPLHFQWYRQSQPVGRRVIPVLDHGDLYAMSEKATGYDWLKKKTLTLRHAAGCNKYLYPKKRKRASE